MESKLSDFRNLLAEKNESSQISINNVDLKLLRVFKSVVEAGGFTSASHELNIGLAAISKQVSDLEIRLGMTLCSRGRDGFFLTEYGSIVYQATLELFSSINQFRDRLQNSRNEILGEINISVIDNTITDRQSPITKAVRQLAHIAPKLNIRLQTEQLDNLERGLNEGRLTCAIAPVYEEKSEFEYYFLYQEESQIYCSNEHEFFHLNDLDITIDMLKNAKVINHSYASIHHKNKVFNFKNSNIQAVQIESVAMLILTGHFIGYLPCHYAERYVEQNLLRPITLESLTIFTRFCFIIKKGKRINTIIKLFMDALGIQSES
ncbi:LysR family transcriptional regulator [Prodigiosinella aquatilis]|nr:LysR family transcriptional regulator [Prodigiosinella sp. LS101]WJV53601.1 LysR family transcriptional regulator [Prodigiosinella sp. LS101]WJV57960.1 LysR family transcriptional regulator [Pectobacteriaceae bacterium C111]